MLVEGHGSARIQQAIGVLVCRAETTECLGPKMDSTDGSLRLLEGFLADVTVLRLRNEACIPNSDCTCRSFNFHP